VNSWALVVQWLAVLQDAKVSLNKLPGRGPSRTTDASSAMCPGVVQRSLASSCVLLVLMFAADYASFYRVLYDGGVSFLSFFPFGFRLVGCLVFLRFRYPLKSHICNPFLFS
jgi:hypothetical protein